jgi:hypothetical protein
VTDNWIFPNPDYPGKIERVIHIDLDDRTPLRDDQADALNAALSQLIKDREDINSRIRKMSQRLVLSGEAKVKEIRELRNLSEEEQAKLDINQKLLLAKLRAEEGKDNGV